MIELNDDLENKIIEILKGNLDNIQQYVIYKFISLCKGKQILKDHLNSCM